MPDFTVDAGGICGFLCGSCTMNNCINYGNITIESAGGTCAGGIIGQTINVQNTVETIENCKNYGTITGNNSIAGIIGYLGRDDKVSNCANYGFINGFISVRWNSWKK